MAFLFPILGLLFLLPSCAHQGSVFKPFETIRKETAKEAAGANIYYKFLESDKAALSGSYEKARAGLEEVIKANPENGYLYYELAMDEADQKHIDSAIEACQKAIELSPKLVQAHLLLARLYSAKEQHAEAVNILEDVIRDFRETEEAYADLGSEYIALKRYNEAAGVMHRWLGVEPESNMAFYYLGMIYGSYLKRYDKALVWYQKIVDSESDNIQAHAAMAQIYLDQRQLKKSLTKLLEIEAIVPDDLSVQLKIALVYYELKDYDRSAERFEKIVATNAESDKIRYYLGSIYLSAQKSDDAMRHFKLIPPKSSFYKDAILQIVRFERAKNNNSEAIKVLEAAIGKKPDEADFYIFLAAFFEEAGELPKVVDVLEKGASELTKNENIAFALAVAFDKAGDQENALSAMKRVVELNPKDASALNYIGYTYAENGKNLDEAEDMLQTAASIRPEDGYIIDSLGWLYFKKGDLTRAYELLSRASQLSPRETTVFEHLGDLHHRRGDDKAALNAYKKALKFAKEKKNLNEEEVKRLEKKICDVGGC